MSVSVATAQVTPEEHAAHHPDQSAEKGAGEQPGEGEGEPAGEGAPADAAAGAMGSMMDLTADPPPKDLYPSLMTLGDLSPEELDVIQQEAAERMQAGLLLMTEALDQLSRASPDDDFEAMQKAGVVFREGFARFESGLAARQLLAEGVPPDQIALDWFRREMNLSPPATIAARGPLGLSWFHFLTMFILIVFGTTMIVLYVKKMRRASALIMRLTETQSGPPSDA